jgi:hypothetical protein
MAIVNQRPAGYYDPIQYAMPQPPSPNRTSASGVNTNAGSEVSVANPTLSQRFDAGGSALSGAAAGAANERDRQMLALRQANQDKLSEYNTNQNATLQALVNAARDRMSGYQTRQGATTDAMSGLQSATSSALANTSNEKIALAKLGMDQPLANAKQSILGSLMATMQPHQFSSPAGQQGHLTQVSGGASLTPGSRELGQTLINQALEAQLSGNKMPSATDFMGGVQDWKKSVLDVPEATDYSKGVLTPPELQDTYKKPGKLESIMGLLGLGGKVAGAIF